MEFTQEQLAGLAALGALTGQTNKAASTTLTARIGTASCVGSKNAVIATAAALATCIRSIHERRRPSRVSG